MTYEQAASLPKSEKITLITCEAAKPVKLFELYSTNVYVRDVPYFVSGIKIGAPGREEQAESIADLGPTKPWFYDISEKKLYITQPVDPKTLDITVIYKFFFSNTPVILPHDLSNGHDVEWNPIVLNIGSIGQQLDNENTGIVLESQSQIEFINNHGFFDEIFDTLIWENQDVKFYSWFSGIPLSESKLIFSGVVESKDYQINKVTFRVKDFVFRLKNKVNLGIFSETDGELLESIIGTPKRRIYGQVKQVQCIPIDCTLDGYELTGTVSITLNSPTMTGVGTQFLKELNQDDDIIFNVNGEEVVYSVNLISSNTSLTLSKDAEQTLTAQKVKVDPERPYRFKNRRWHIAGHKIRETEAKILNIINARTFVVDNVSEFFQGDVVSVNNQFTQITRISGDQLVLEQNIFPIPAIDDIVSRYPITKAHFGEMELIPFRDFTLTNNSEAILEINSLAEFNIARETVTDHNLSFVDNSFEVSSSANADLRTIIKPGYFIRPEVQSNENWYEVHHVGPQVVYLKTRFNQGGGNANHPARIKIMDVINDDSLITVDCYGKETGNKWMATASDCVKDLIENDANFELINEASFDQAKSDCPYVLSMVIPGIGGEAPTIRDVISQINESVFGSLYGNSSQELSYSIVNTRKPEQLVEIRDDDIISWTSQSNQNIVNFVKINYQPSVDKVTGEDSFSAVTFQNSFVTNTIGINNTIEKFCYLFNKSDAETIAQRYAFFNSLSTSLITIKGKSGFFTSSVNDRVFINFDRLYRRYAGNNDSKIGIISAIKKDSYGVEVTINDLGNIFNRCPVISPSTASSFTSASEDEKIKFGYIVDTETFLPGDSEESLGSNLIG